MQIHCTYLVHTIQKFLKKQYYEETGEVVVEEEFVDETEVTIDQTGSYIVQIYSGNTIMTGEFEVE